MKKIVTLLLMVSGISLHAQIQIGSNEIPTMNRPGKISNSQLADFKKTTTVFTLQFKDYEQKAQFEQAIASVWKITPFKIVKPDDLGKYMGKGYSVFSFGGVSVQQQWKDIAPSSMHLSYDLWLPEQKNNGNVKQAYLAKIWLSPSNTSVFENKKNSNSRQKSYSQKMLSFIYSEAVFYNWSPGYLKGYLKLVNDRLEKGAELGPYSDFEDENKLAKLRKDTLYIPEYVFIQFNKFTGKEHLEMPENGELQKYYPYPHRVVTTDELNQLILSGNSVKYLVYVKSSTDKFVDVYDGQSGELLYAEHESMSYNFKEKDLKEIAKEVD